MLTTREEDVLRWVTECGGVTDDELEVIGEVGDGHVIDRLEELGLVVFDGERFRPVWN